MRARFAMICRAQYPVEGPIARHGSMMPVPSVTTAKGRMRVGKRFRLARALREPVRLIKRKAGIRLIRTIPARPLHVHRLDRSGLAEPDLQGKAVAAK